MSIRDRLHIGARAHGEMIVVATAVILVVAAVGLMISAPQSRAGEQDRLSFLAHASGERSWTQVMDALMVRMDPAALSLAREFDPLGPAMAPGFVGAPGLPGAADPAAAPAPLENAFAALAPDEAERLNASIPFVEGPAPAPAPFFIDGASDQDRERALHCLTQAIYYEAGFEPVAGREAVAQVVLNRVRHPAYPKSVCGVVYQGSDQATGCQFTFTCDGALSRGPVPTAWREAEQIAARALNGYVARAVGTATHYHTQWVLPYWAPHLLKLKQIGAHIFYRWPGGWGLPMAFRAAYAGGETVGGNSAVRIQASFETGVGTGSSEAAPNFKVSEPVESATTVLAAAQPPTLKLAETMKPSGQLSVATPTLLPPEAPQRAGRIAAPAGF